jgi:hypothetical protein
MLKLLLSLASLAVLAAMLLQLRQQHRELTHQCNDLHNQIEATQTKLWNQQLQIAIYTAPNAITKTVGDHDLHLVPPTPLPGGTANWIDARGSGQN